MMPSYNQIKELLAFLPVLENPTEVFGNRHGLEALPDGRLSMPWVDYTPGVQRFMRCASQPGLSDPDYQTKKPQNWLNNPDFLTTASLDDSLTLLTFCLRRERSVEGAMLKDLQTGLIQKILRHIQTICPMDGSQQTSVLLGAIAGDLIGSIYEHKPIKSVDFPLFSEECRITDDSVLTIAVADAILNGGNYAEKLHAYGQKYPNAGYGSAFKKWLHSTQPVPYHSFGNGSAMRVSPVAWAFETVEIVLSEAQRSAEVTHNHPEGIRGAQAVALAIFLARQGAVKETIRNEVQARMGYDLSRQLNKLRREYTWDVTCQGSVPESIIAFLESENVESAIRNAISLGGDADTMAAISGSIAEAYYGGVPDYVVNKVMETIPIEFREVIKNFQDKTSGAQLV